MKTIFILLIFAVTPMGYGVAVTTQQFQSEQTCRAAADWYKTKSWVEVTCIPDAAPEKAGP